MTTLEFQTDLEAKLANMSDEVLQYKLEAVGCVFVDPWHEAILSNENQIESPEGDWMGSGAADSNELALAA